MDFKSGKYLIPAFFSILVFMTAGYAMGCSPYLMGLHDHTAGILGASLSIGTALSILLFLYSYIVQLSCISQNQSKPSTSSSFKTQAICVIKFIVLPLTLLVYGVVLRYGLQFICVGHIDN